MFSSFLIFRQTKQNNKYFLFNTPADGSNDCQVTQQFLFVAVAPSLTTRPSNLTLVEGDEATFLCSATGNPTPKMTWIKDGKTVGSGETLRFTANRNQSGKYWCLAENGFNSTANASAYLDVHCKYF